VAGVTGVATGLAAAAVTRRCDLRGADGHALLRREWLLTNGLGGYASGTVGGAVARRYHGLLIAALPAPLGRVVMFNHLAESVLTADGDRVRIGGFLPGEGQDGADEQSRHLVEFRLEEQLPVWVFEVGSVQVEKRVVVVHGQNTVHVGYRLLSGAEQVRLELRPAFQFRPHGEEVGRGSGRPYVLEIVGSHYEVRGEDPLPALRIFVGERAGVFTHAGGEDREMSYPTEAELGYHSRGVLWSPGVFSLALGLRAPVTFSASTEGWDTFLALRPEQAWRFEQVRRRRLISIAHPALREEPVAELVLAADQFLIAPSGRVEDVARAHASGDEVRSVIAGYHWFTDWGRDTMISLEGLTMVTGRMPEAGWVLRTFAHHVCDGLIPNFFPDGQNEGVYHTADASLWFFHALDRYLELSGDRQTLQAVFPKLREIIGRHLQGTRFHIGVDGADGLLRQGAEGYQLTWMDAKVEGWVVTPRRGKAVEINALWYNALRLFAGWLREGGDTVEGLRMETEARRVAESFNARFWNAEAGCLFDVVDGEHGDDPACRPNQLIAFSLRHPVLEQGRWRAVLEVVERELWTPRGLRSLSPRHPDYKPTYFGNLRARDAAYHQGTVWGWLVGPFLDAWLRVYPGRVGEARVYVAQMLEHLDEACLGSISEIFDAQPPFAARGCVAQAWSVAEVLRLWVKTAPG